MQDVPIPNNEILRLRSLYQYQILDTESEAAFDDLTRLAASICDTPIASVSLIDAQRQWFKSRIGIPTTETPRHLAFCSYTILQSDAMIISDTLDDERFATHPAVLNSPYIRFYAGVPLITPDGYSLGTTCVADVVPRQLTATQIEALKALSRQVVAQLELRRKLLEADVLKREFQQTEAALRESEKRFRTMADTTSVLIWLDDLKQQAIFHNRSWLQFTGRLPEQELGEGWKQSLYPDDQLHWSNVYTAAFTAQAPYTVEYRLRRADGVYRWMLETGVPRFHPDGSFGGFTGSCIDISDRKAAEEYNQLLQSVAQAIIASSDFHSALQVAIEKVCEATQWDFGEAWIPSLNKNVMECSPAWYSKIESLREFRQQSQTYTFPPGIGIPGRVWISKETEWHQDISLESDTIYLRNQLAMTSGLKATLGVPLLANDEVITVLVFYMSEARPEDRRLIDLIAASTELGLFIQRKQVEEEVRKSLAKEQELNKFKSDFIANMSHELSTPLTSVLGLSSVLLQQHFGSLNSKQKQYLDMIQSSGDHLLSLINDLLDLAKIEAGKQELERETVDILALCQSAIAMIDVRATTKQQQLILQQPMVVRAISVDPRRILQILLNYLSNAVKFTPNGGTIMLSNRLASASELEANTLSVEPAHTASDCILSDDRFLVLEVHDTGIGIPREKQHLLFRSFQQVDVQHHPNEGSGLGLALSKQLAELHGGRVSFRSVVGNGSTFSVWLPLR